MLETSVYRCILPPDCTIVEGLVPLFTPVPTHSSPSMRVSWMNEHGCLGWWKEMNNSFRMFGGYHWDLSSKMYSFFFSWMLFLLNMNFRSLTLQSLHMNQFWWFPCACVMMCDFRLQFHSSACAARPIQFHISIFPPPPAHHQPTHEEASSSGPWLSIGKSAQEFLIFQCSLDLFLGCIQWSPCW